MMHQIMAEELKNMWSTRGSTDEWADLVRAAIEKSFLRMDYVALNLCICGKKGSYCRYCCKPQEYAMVGSTAAVAILTPNRIVVANCGDSRAVLCHAGKPIPLSVDHKVGTTTTTTTIFLCMVTRYDSSYYVCSFYWAAIQSYLN